MISLFSYSYCTRIAINYNCAFEIISSFGVIFQPDYASIAKHCNIWRNFNDIDDSWDSVLGIIEFYGDDKTHFTEVAGPGNFNDPDMVCS